MLSCVLCAMKGMWFSKQSVAEGRGNSRVMCSVSGDTREECGSIKVSGKG